MAVLYVCSSLRFTSEEGELFVFRVTGSIRDALQRMGHVYTLETNARTVVNPLICIGNENKLIFFLNHFNGDK